MNLYPKPTKTAYERARIRPDPGGNHLVRLSALLRMPDCPQRFRCRIVHEAGCPHPQKRCNCNAQVHLQESP